MPPSVIVIGAGVIGATTAWELAAAGADVRVLDARRPGLGATRASAGVLAPCIEGVPSSPMRKLGRDSLDLYDAFVDRLRQDSQHPVPYERNGTFEVALTLTEAEALAASSGELWREGVEARWVPAAGIEDVEPAVTRGAAGGLLIPMHGYVDVRALTLASIAAAEARGAELFVETGAIEVLPLAGGGVSVTTAHSSWDAECVVMAAGSWTSAIAIAGADPLPVSPIRGQLLHFRQANVALRHVVWGTRGYLVPWQDGSVLAGATVEDVGFDESATDEARQGLAQMAATLVPALEGLDPSDVRVGLRPRTPDELPIVGRSTAVPGLVYATGHYRNGVLLAPLTAHLVRDLVLDARRQTLAELDPLRCGKV